MLTPKPRQKQVPADDVQIRSKIFSRQGKDTSSSNASAFISKFVAPAKLRPNSPLKTGKVTLILLEKVSEPPCSLVFNFFQATQLSCPPGSPLASSELR